MHDIFKKYNPSSVSSSIKRKSDLRINIYHVTFKIDGNKYKYKYKNAYTYYIDVDYFK